MMNIEPVLWRWRHKARPEWVGVFDNALPSDLDHMVETEALCLHSEAASEIGRLTEENRRLREALKNLLQRDQRNTCQHENTHRGGFIWEICDDCGAKWADDCGGKPEWEDPKEWVDAEKILAVTHD